MTLDLQQVTEVLHKYYKGQQWRAVAPVETEPPIIDELGNLIEGLEWHETNTLPKPSSEEIKNLWDQIYNSGEYLHQHPPIPSITGPNPFNGKTSEYAQALLKDSDWAALPDVGLANQSEWDAYRATLRSIRSNPSRTVEFPTKPEVRYQ